MSKKTCPHVFGEYRPERHLGNYVPWASISYMLIEVGEGELVLGGLLVVEDAGVLEPVPRVADPGALVGSVCRKRLDPDPSLCDHPDSKPPPIEFFCNIN